MISEQTEYFVVGFDFFYNWFIFFPFLNLLFIFMESDL
ncbi:hypothetical protein WZ342_2389 [Enterococcus faecalis]|nr:hypothetical protein WZ342_2389 [Enterococcus faecalis]